ncbi:conjugative transposon protein TraJ [Pelobium manganitolerans]|uniref:conjugative transposon protein TraJ n=1 Tax=Pelobium manganitolerans TaxID=1842495 RepID=UPI003FA3A402
MLNKKLIALLCAVASGILLPSFSFAQGLNGNAGGLYAVLDNLYQEMMPMCGKLISTAQGIAGFATIWYIGSRIWRHLANAEPIDFYPLLRPFALGFCIMIFPQVLNLLNGILNPTVVATASMVKDSNRAINALLQQKEKMVKESDAYQMYVGMQGDGDREKWYKYTYDKNPTEEGVFEGLGNDFKFSMAKLSYSFRNSIKQWMSEVLEVIFQAAALCINTLRVFNLVVLSILGPFVFGIAVFDGFQHTLTSWIARYINTFLWLPVANIFGSIIGRIQEKMLAIDVSQVSNSQDTFFSSTDTAYLIFMIISIVGYFTVPTVAGYIVNAGGGGAMVQKVTNLLSSGTVGLATSAGSSLYRGAGSIAQASMSGTGTSAGNYQSQAGSHLGNKISNSKS